MPRPPSTPNRAAPGSQDANSDRLARVTDPVRRGYAAYGRRAEAWTAQYLERGGRVYCGAGCFACCNMPIRVSLAEALVTAGALTDAEAARVETHARRVMENARTAPSDDVYVERHREGVGYCPLLSPETGGCTRYDVRPTRCRDTFSALPARYCEAGAWERMGRREREQYRREVARTPGTDGELHFIAPLEHLSEPIWAAASKAMRAEWGLEVWGDFWVLTTLARNADFMARVQQGDGRGAWRAARAAGLAHPTVLEVG